MLSTTEDMEGLQNEARVFKFITGPLTMAMRAAFAAIYCHRDMDSEGGTLTLRKCLSNRKVKRTKLPTDKKQLKDIFGSRVANEVKDCKILNKSLDIQFYHAAITQFCHSIYEKHVSTVTKDLINAAKTERNNLAHKNRKIQDSILNVMKNLTDLCNELINNVERDLGGSHIDAARHDIQSLIKSISNEKPNIDQYKQDQLKFFEDYKNRFVQDSQAHLQNERELESTVDPFIKLVRQVYFSSGTKLTISEVFTPPLMHWRGTIVNFNEILTTAEEVGKTPRTVFVSGQGGSGKSTLCRVIFDQWRKKSFKPLEIKELSSIDIVIYIELKYTVSEKLEDYLRNEYLVDQLKDIKDKMSELFNGLKVLVLVDGYDEKKQNGDKLIRDIISSLPESRLIVTTRPEYLPDPEEVIQTVTHMTFVLEGFGDRERSKFAGNVFRLVEKDDQIRKDKAKQYNEYLRGRASCLQEHLKLPLTMALLTVLWLENVDNPHSAMNSINTATELYRQLSKMLKDKLIKVRTNFKNEDSLDDIINLLKEKAFKQLKANQLLTLTEENQKRIREECKNETNCNEILSGFLICEARNRTGAAKKKSASIIQYSFFHRSQMEYYSAQYIADDLDSNGSFAKYFDMNDRKNKEILPFLAGCLKANGKLRKHCSALLHVCKAVAGENDFDFWFKLLHETESNDCITGEPVYDQAMTNSIVSYLPAKSWSLQGLPVKTVISALKLLTNCPRIKIEELSIHIPNNDGLYSNKELQSTLKKLENFRRTLQQEPRTKLVLNFFGYCQDSTNYLSDPLEYFGSWCKVVEFTGRLQEKSVQHLQHCRIVTVKVNKLATFNAIAVQSFSMHDLKRLHIKVHFSNGEVQSENLKRIAQGKGKTDITFLKLIDNDVQKTITFVLDTCPESRGFNYVTMEGRLNNKDGMKILEQFQSKVTKVCVLSAGLSDEESSALSHMAKKMCSTFLLDWNNEKIY